MIRAQSRDAPLIGRRNQFPGGDLHPLRASPFHPAQRYKLTFANPAPGNWLQMNANSEKVTATFTAFEQQRRLGREGQGLRRTPHRPPCPRHRAGPACQGPWRVREAAKRNKKIRFNALLHHVTTSFLRDCFRATKRQAAPEVDGVTWQEYEQNLENRLMGPRAASIEEHTEPNLRDECTFPKPTDGNVRWASLPWRTRSSNRQWCFFSNRSTRRSFWDSRTGFGPDVDHMQRWAH
jgi:hypothetical protein